MRRFEALLGFARRQEPTHLRLIASLSWFQRDAYKAGRSSLACKAAAAFQLCQPGGVARFSGDGLSVALRNHGLCTKWMCDWKMFSELWSGPWHLRGSFQICGLRCRRLSEETVLKEIDSN